MNKKFSTLLAGMALLSVMSVNAQDGGTTEPAVTTTIPALEKATSVSKLKEGVNTELYQLKVGNGVLAMDKEGKLYVETGTLNSGNMANTLWCVTVATQVDGQAPKFDFENRATGMILDIAISDVEKENTWYNAQTGGDVSGWAFSRSYKEMETDKALFSYVNSEYVLGFKIADDGKTVQVAKIKATAYNRDENKYTADDKSEKKDYFVKFTLESPADIYLDATELNTIFDTYTDAKHGLKLSFDKDILGTDIPNPFNAQSFYTESAEKLDGTNTKKEPVSKVPYLYVRQKDKESYLRVDTAYTNEKGVPFLAYKWNSDWVDVDEDGNKTEYKDASDYLDKSTLKDQYKFLFVYSPKNDNVQIYIHTVTNKDINDDKAYWYASTNKGYNYHVSLQDLIKDKTRILTVDKDNQNTTITLGYTSCGAVTPTRTSLADNVYFIQNAKGQYLASPIHKNGEIEWVTVNEKQDVNHMPAYQWVALKTNASDKNGVSPVQFINREFADKKISSVQLHKQAGKEVYYTTSDQSLVDDTHSKIITAKEELTITPVAADFQNNKYLGYKKLTRDELLVNKYTFNYYHPYADNKFIAQSSKDSMLIVMDGKDAFVLDTVSAKRKTGADEAYGYYPSDETTQKRLPNLVQLYRTVYTVKKGDKDWAINKEDKFNVSNYWKNNNDGNEKVKAFFFKENNCIDGTHYYAILSAEIESGKTEYSILKDNKAGVSDYDGDATLKAQVLSETRTSAFAIAPDNTPLYRRFNNAVLGENDQDGPDSLIFVEKYRKEYLMDEANGSFLDKDGVVDYLGIWSKDKAKNKLAMRVDTAWLKRGAGEVKPQYLISVTRMDQEGIETIPCDEADDKHFYIDEDGNAHKTDKWHCQHAKPGRPGFAYGKYLVSFADSARMEDSNKQPWMDIANGYTRVGFVKAIHFGDSLYILVNGFEKKNPEDLNVEEIIKTYKADKIDSKYIVNLQGDQHKNVTWSFRYVNPEKAGKVTEEGDDNAFMFESNVYTDTPSETASIDEKNAAMNIPLGNNHKLGNAIAPKFAAWLKMQNGCLVLTRYNSDFNASKTGGDAALVFNVDQKTDSEDMVTDNETINAVEGISIVAGNGTVTVQGAAGKSVVITNILGKVIAETVLTSDNATISVPAGIVAVAVDGEEAAKTIVK